MDKSNIIPETQKSIFKKNWIFFYPHLKDIVKSNTKLIEYLNTIPELIPTDNSVENLNILIIYMIKLLLIKILLSKIN